jgi:hypothetical protein
VITFTYQTVWNKIDRCFLSESNKILVFYTSFSRILMKNSSVEQIERDVFYFISSEFSFHSWNIFKFTTYLFTLIIICISNINWIRSSFQKMIALNCFVILSFLTNFVICLRENLFDINNDSPGLDYSLVIFILLVVVFIMILFLIFILFLRIVYTVYQICKYLY